MGGGKESAFGDESQEEKTLLSPAEQDKGLRVEEEAKQQSWVPNSAASLPRAPPSPPAQDLSSAEESSTTESKIKASASSSRRATLSTAASKAPLKVPRIKTGKSSLVRARNKLLSYRPGSFLGSKAEKFKIPDVTSLLVVGMRGSGKSAVVNRIIRVLEGEAAEFYRAPLSGSNDQSGTYFLSEYSICNASVSLFDTRGFTDSEVAEGMSVPEEWMTQGVRDGQMELRSGDAKDLREEVKLRGRHVDHMLSKRRNVNFVIFVVNAAHFMDRERNGDRRALAKLKMLYENPFFCFRDDRPMVVMTHTDELGGYDRLRAPSALARRLKVPSLEQIYDISGPPSHGSVGDEEGATARDKASLEMLMTALQRADRHLAQKKSVLRSLFHIYDDYLDYARNSDQLKLNLHMKIIALYMFFVIFVYFCAVLLRTHRSPMHWMEQMAEGNTVTINLRWLGKKIRF